MAPITTYFFMFISSVFYVLYDAHLAMEDFTLLTRLTFPYLSTTGHGLAFADFPMSPVMFVSGKRELHERSMQ
ncbi:hypothetical protein RIF29_23416 [Crotalaria pallida]|uniref:Uncharacterized protein n=1 Tax=Crotalaria pallida TaxID=3830 RepID=A0AAN9F620_CROPI